MTRAVLLLALGVLLACLLRRERHQPETSRLRDHEWCVPHEHVETDMARWERDQALSLAYVLRREPTATAELSSFVEPWGDL